MGWICESISRNIPLIAIDKELAPLRKGKINYSIKMGIFQDKDSKASFLGFEKACFYKNGGKGTRL